MEEIIKWVNDNFWISWLIMILLLALFNRFLKNRSKNMEPKITCPELSTSSVSPEEDEVYETELVEMGKQEVYPLCPHCGGKIKNFMVMESEESDNHESFTFVVCPNCKKTISVM